MRVDESYKQAMNTPSPLKGKGAKAAFGLVLWPFLHLKSFIALLLLILFCVGLVMFTRLGVVKIPLLSAWFYREPQPDAWVRVISGEEATRRLGAQVLAVQQGGTKEIALSNEELTALLKVGLKGTNVPVDFMQVDIQMNRLDMYARMWGKIIFSAKAAPYVSGEKVRWGLTYCAIGNQRIPCGLIPSVLTDKMTEVASQGFGTWKLEGVRLEDNQLILSVSL